MSQQSSLCVGKAVYSRISYVLLVFLAAALSGCITTSMQGYADRNLPTRPVGHIAALVLAPGALAANTQSSVREEATKHGVLVDDALVLFPPTRAYTEAEIRNGLLSRGIDGVLVIQIGDSGVVKEYAGTVFYGQYSGSSLGNVSITNFGNMSSGSFNGSSIGTMTAVSTPMYGYRRQMNFTARLLEPSSGRNLWVGNGQVSAGGLLFVGDRANASNLISAIFDDLHKKGIIGTRPS